MILCLQAWRLLSPGLSGRSISVLACLLAYRMRGRLRVFLGRRWSTFSSAAILLVQWAAATTLLSARTAFSDMATRFFQSGFTYLCGQVATLTAFPSTRSPDIQEQIDTPPIDQDKAKLFDQPLIVPPADTVPNMACITRAACRR